jgi:exoribonuclease R
MDEAVAAAGSMGELVRSYSELKHLSPAANTVDMSHHYGLGVTGYTRATSPIRRFEDLVLHQQIKSFLRHGSTDRLPYERAELSVLAHEIGSQENIFNRLEKARSRYWLLEMLRLQVRATIMTHDALSTIMTHDALSTAPWYDGGAGEVVAGHVQLAEGGEVWPWKGGHNEGWCGEE